MDYRLYFMNEKGRIRHMVEMQCDDDETAIKTVEEHADGRAMELWRLDVLVKAFPVTGKPAPSA